MLELYEVVVAGAIVYMIYNIALNIAEDIVYAVKYLKNKKK